jgi:16S rRNA (guanine966-N2)-methyltransferase
MAPRRSRKSTKPATSSGNAPPSLRIIGGRFRGRTLAYNGDPRTRPMKDRTRESVFNLLGPSIVGKHAIDLFAGTGALGLEALSRGAARATLLERHFPTARVIRQNVETLGLVEHAEVVAADTFVWARRPSISDERPWVVFCSPPYDFYVDRAAEMLALIETFAQRSPPGSMVVVEADSRFDTTQLPRAGEWDLRHYAPAVIGILYGET